MYILLFESCADLSPDPLKLTTRFPRCQLQRTSELFRRFVSSVDVCSFFYGPAQKLAYRSVVPQQSYGESGCESYLTYCILQS